MSSDSSSSDRHVKCPRCGKPSLFTAENASRPFCSERCKLIDLGQWAEEKYAIPTKPAMDADSEPDEDSEPIDNDPEAASSGENPPIHWIFFRWPIESSRASILLRTTTIAGAGAPLMGPNEFLASFGACNFKRSNMNKAELIDLISSETKSTKAQAERMLDATLDCIKKTVKKGDEVKLVGFGTFTKAKRKARMGRNPQTGKSIKIPATWFPKFRPGAEFKSIVR
jgi:DNA-binding protein HU-beta